MEFILEINTEEMPPAHVETALIQLKEGLAAALKANDVVDEKNRLGKIETYGTCRRLIVCGDFFPRQRDIEKEFIGPPKSVAYTSEGTPLPAALGFAKSQNVDVSQLRVIQSQKGEYVGLKKIIKGKPADEILSNILPGIILDLSFPKMMRWGSYPFKFSRPIHNIFCIFDGKLIDFEVAGNKTTDFTIGHVLVSPIKIKVRSFQDYKTQLTKNKVIITKDIRKNRIIKLISEKLESFEARFHPDEQLLEKLSMDIEYPYVIMGTFPEKYLKLPIEVLSTAMRVGQNLFSVVKGRKQLPVFMGVTDGCRDVKALVRKGNERVLKARLEDARFFWEQDLDRPLQKKYDDLDRIVFQEKLGSYQDKSERLKKIAGYLSEKLGAKQEKRSIVKAAELCKVDLLTELVREFPSLQGKAGGLYARKEGHPVSVWKTIYEHYQPVYVGDGLPSTLAGAILAVVDKIDSLVGVLGLGVEISGSKDPFGIRRNAQGICSIVIEKKLSFSLPRLLDKVIAVYENSLESSKIELKALCMEFFKGRLEYLFERQGFRYDLINAVLSRDLNNVYHTFLRLKALESLKNSSQFEPLILIAKRVNNILRDQAHYKVNSVLLEEKEERELYTTFSIINDNVAPLLARGEFAKAQRIIFTIRSSINSFFDHVLVMDENKKLKRNRLALLQSISKLFMQVADYSQVVIAGQKN